MARYIVIKDILNFRNRPRLADEHFIGSAKLGEELELFDDPVAGETPAGTDDEHWLVDNQNRFVSRAGVALQGTYAARKASFLADIFNAPYFDTSDKENEDKWKVSWGHVDLEIWRIWKEHKTMGEGVKIVIIDSGISKNNPDLTIQDSLCHYSPKDGGDFFDTDGHGTMCAGIAGANGAKSVFGVAPLSQILIAKIYDKTGDVSAASISDALVWAQRQNPDIISLSFTTGQDIAITKELKNAFDRGILLTAAIGNAGEVNIIDNDVYPACQDFCIAIGALSKDIPARLRRTTPSQRLKFLLPGEKIMTLTLTSAGPIGVDASVATPLMAGVLALFISMIKQNKIKVSQKELINQLFDSGFPITETIENTSLEYKIPQPYQLLSKLVKPNS